MSVEQIVEKINRCGRIYVSWRWRSSGARKKLHDMVRKGLIRKGVCAGGLDEFLPLSLSK